MSVIQKIRDKYAVWIIVLICLAIVSFLLQDVFFGRTGMGQSNVVGKVNGVELTNTDYQRRIEFTTEQMRQRMPGQTFDEEAQQYFREEAWNGFLRENIMSEQYEALGITVTDAEVVDAFNANNPHPLVRQQFANRETGEFDPSVIQQLNQAAKQDPNMRAQLLQFDQAIVEYQQNLKYYSLINKGIYYPKWLAKQQQEDASKVANIGYVQVPYSTIADSTIKPSDAELNKYIQDNKGMFEVPEGRKLEYVSFDVIPTAADSAAALADIQKLKAEMDTTPDVAQFVKLNSEYNQYDGYVSRSAIQVPNKDSIIDLPKGATFGPYLDGNMLVYAKMIDRKTMADTVKLRQVLIFAQQGADSIAKKRADSVEAVVRGGGDIAAIATTISQDPNAKQTGGEVTLAPHTDMPAELAEVKTFAFDGTTGAVKTVKLPIGYAVVKIMEQKNVGPALKIAYLGKRVDASSASSNDMLTAANEFASANTSRDKFEKAIQQKGLNKKIAENIQPMDFVLPGLGSAREIVNWAYSAKKNDVSRVFSLEDRFVVAVLTSIREKGTAPLDEVRPTVEAEVRKQKKADQIIAKIGTPANLDAAAKATNQPVLTAEGLNFSSSYAPALNFEPRVIGAAFNKAWGTAKVSAPIQGQAGVFVIHVNNYTESGIGNLDYGQQSQAFEGAMQQLVQQQLFQSVLKKNSNVKDNRAEFFRSN
ncbi:SurA N-terminal domain-containing protein [Chitinophaga sp. NPDC101104]|uniref:peptidylprolyl isomerase n=1 Tax=Chitinophaga sp. NPDC101104 TaxID=3390561 RepID=UPI003CFF835D